MARTALVRVDNTGRGLGKRDSDEGKRLYQPGPRPVFSGFSHSDSDATPNQKFSATPTAKVRISTRRVESRRAESASDSSMWTWLGIVYSTVPVISQSPG